MESSEDREPPADLPGGELLSHLFSPGDYRHRMGLRRANANEFYAATPAAGTIRREKESILDRDGERYTLTTPEGHHAAVEFAETLGLQPDGRETPQALCRRLSLELEPDLLFVQPPDWLLVWASVCFPSRWSLDDKARRPLTWIHEAVPGLNPELGGKIGTFFARLPPGEGWRRANWGLSASPRRNQHPRETIPLLTPETPPGQVFIRVEDQHLLKLPGTGAIAFGIRIANFAWSAAMRNPAVAPHLLEKLRTMHPEIARYKALTDFIPAATGKSP